MRLVLNFHNPLKLVLEALDEQLLHHITIFATLDDRVVNLVLIKEFLDILTRDATGAAVHAPGGIGAALAVLLAVRGSITAMEKEALADCFPVRALPPHSLAQSVVQSIHDCLGEVAPSRHLALFLNHLDDLLVIHQAEMLFDVGVLLRRVVPVQLQGELYVVLFAVELVDYAQH